MLSSGPPSWPTLHPPAARAARFRALSHASAPHPTSCAHTVPISEPPSRPTLTHPPRPRGSSSDPPAPPHTHPLRPAGSAPAAPRFRPLGCFRSETLLNVSRHAGNPPHQSQRFRRRASGTTRLGCEPRGQQYGAHANDSWRASPTRAAASLAASPVSPVSPVSPASPPRPSRRLEHHPPPRRTVSPPPPSHLLNLPRRLTCLAASPRVGSGVIKETIPPRVGVHRAPSPT